jgi:hypothetical protein
MLDSIFAFINSTIVFIIEAMLYIPLIILRTFLVGLTSIITDIGAPDFINNFASIIASIPPDALYWFDFFEFEQGMQIMTAALLIRFVIKMIPTIG